MTVELQRALPWLAAAAAVWLLRLGDPVAERWAWLVSRGRLAQALPGHRGRGRRPMVRQWAGGPLVAVISGAGFAGATIRAGPAVGLAAAITLAVGGRAVLATARRRRDRRGAVRLLAALRVLVAELEAGTSPDDALVAAGGIDTARAGRFAAAAEASRSGGEVGAVLGAEPELALLGRAWTVAITTGASLVDVLARVADDLGTRLEQADAVSAALAGPRSSALLLAGLPLLGIALGAALAARPVPFLLGDPAGRLVLLAGVTLDAAGLLWTRRLADRAERP